MPAVSDDDEDAVMQHVSAIDHEVNPAAAA
jgi:hypothetical protein